MNFESRGNLAEVDHEVLDEFGAFIAMHQEIQFVMSKFITNVARGHRERQRSSRRGSGAVRLNLVVGGGPG
jgi:hypothetical protein